jgi:FAD/FMN-containing dehydrogenase
MSNIQDFARHIDNLGKDFAGQLLQPSSPGYDDARRVHNGLIDKRPALIARCTGVADIADALEFGRELGLEIAVKGGGHNVAGRATIDAGLMIDLSPMKGVHVDAKRKVAHAQGGATWREFNRETQLHGLATTGGVVSTTGIAGLTLGGGIGWLMGKHGLALDNLLSVRIVTADGKVLSANAEENSDLFWAVRGGGGNFGIVGSFEYRLHPVGPMITGGLIAHPFERARDLLRFYRDFTQSLPDELIVFAGLVHAPDGSGTKLAAFVAAHCGDPSAGAAAMKPLKSFGTPIMDAVGPMTYSALNSLLDAAYPRGALNHWKSSFLSQLSDDAIDNLIECFGRCPTPMGQLLLEHFHGAACRVGVSETAFPHRSPGYNLVVLSEWLQPADTQKCTRWARESYDTLRPWMSSNRYVNYLGDDEGGDTMAAAYGINYPRLQKIKAKYDPYNILHMNQNILPAR